MYHCTINSKQTRIKFKKNYVGITIKSQEQVASQLRIQLAIHSIDNFGHYLCLFMQIHLSWVVTSVHTQMKHVLQQIYKILIPTLEDIIISSTNQANQGLSLIYLLFYLSMHGCNYIPRWNCVCMNRHIHIVANAAYRVGSQQFLSQIASYLFPYFYCDLYFLFKFLIGINLNRLTVHYLKTRCS